MTQLFWILMLMAQLASPSLKPLPPVPAESADRIEVVLYSDFQCPYCKQFAEPFRELQTMGIEGVKATVQFKNFPLSIHSNAQAAHQAAMAAKEQGKFWEMHDLLFANQSKAQRDDLIGYARKLGLDLKRFEKDMTSERLKKTIADDEAEGLKRGVTGTPTFFVNGKAYSGTRSFEQLKQIILADKRRTRALTDITDKMLSRGPADAPVTIEFFADFESPVTPPAMDALNALIARYPDKIRLQFRNFPLSFHRLAPLAHEAAMTAAREGHFWEFADYILGHQESLREQDLIGHAAKLGMDEAKFAKSIQDHQYAGRVDADLEAGMARGIRGSPVVFVNSKRIDGVPSLQTLMDDVEAQLANSAGKLIEKP